jgi:8-oxo-dGTP pyrophosphatase MutT (NUDIX family)
MASDGMIKHDTAHAYVFHRFPDKWRIGLIWHARLGWRVNMGGHVEAAETPYEAMVRRVAEESGLHDLRVAPGTGDGYRTLARPEVDQRRPDPWWVTNFDVPVPGDGHLAVPHVHIDHQYVAIVEDPEPSGVSECSLGWFGSDELSSLRMSEVSRFMAWWLFSRLGDGLAR